MKQNAFLKLKKCPKCGRVPEKVYGCGWDHDVALCRCGWRKTYKTTT